MCKVFFWGNFAFRTSDSSPKDSSVSEKNFFFKALLKDGKNVKVHIRKI